MHFPPIEYLEWDMRLPPDVNHIGASGIRPVGIGEIGAMDLAGEGLPFDSRPDRGLGPEEARIAIAARYAVTPEQVYPTEGTSLANFVAAAAVLEGGGHALVEEPVYTPLLRQVEALARSVDRVPRPMAKGFMLDPDDLTARIRADTRLVAISDLHNPSGVRLGDQVLKSLAERCERVGATLLVDEVYRDFVFDEPPRSTASLAPNIVATSSLTKVYGLGGLRFGWIIGPPALMARAARVYLHLGASHPGPTVVLGTRALKRAEDLRARARNLLQESRSILHTWLEGRDDLEVVWPEAGSVVFPRWRGGDTTELAERLLIEKRTVIVPGRFFLAPWGMRLAATAAPERLREGLAALAEALESAVPGRASRW
jgi:aspartate/methionine/tyrosine aminotransferase